jgi:hypothetical protein
MYKFLITTLFITTLSIEASQNKTAWSDKIYTQTNYILKDVQIIKKYLNVNTKASSKDIKINMFIRHTRARAYEIFTKLNILRSSYSLPLIEAPNMEPTTETNPIYTYTQLERLKTEVDILKQHLGINSKPKPLKIVTNKNITDTYNLLGQVSAELDTINAKAFTPSHVFSEAMRIYEDIDAILVKLSINDNISPPKKEINDKPIDTYKIAIKILNKIKSLESNSGIESINFYAFDRTNITPSDVFEITQIILAELQIIKAYIGLNHEITRGAKYYTNKTPADAAQLMGWLYKKIKLIESLDIKNRGIL